MDGPILFEIRRWHHAPDGRKHFRCDKCGFTLSPKQLRGREESVNPAIISFGLHNEPGSLDWKRPLFSVTLCAPCGEVFTEYYRLAMIASAYRKLQDTLSKYKVQTRAPAQYTTISDLFMDALSDKAMEQDRLSEYLLARWWPELPALIAAHEEAQG